MVETSIQIELNTNQVVKQKVGFDATNSMVNLCTMRYSGSDTCKRPSLNVPFSGINSTSMFYFQSVLAISQTPFILSNEKVYKSHSYDIYGGIIARYRKKPEKETLAFPYLLSSSFERWLHCRRSCFRRHHSNEKTVIGIFQTRTLRPVPVYGGMQVRQLANSFQSFYRFFDHHMPSIHSSSCW